MRFKLAALPLMLLAATAGAEEYNSITKLHYAHTDYDYDFLDWDSDQFMANTTYFFGQKETLGPLKEFEYINKVSNIYGGYNHYNRGSFDRDTFSAGGEYFASNGLVFGAGIVDLWEGNVDYQSIGYLFTPDFLVTLNHFDNDSDNEFSLDMRYNYQLSGNNYIGFNLSIDEELDSGTLSSKYFMHLGGEQYLTAELRYTKYDYGDDIWAPEGDDFWSLGTEYFFTQRTSVAFTFDEADRYSLGMNHYLNRNVAVEVGYASDTESDNIDYDIYQVGLTVQL
ncbi:putative porin [Microbulbifer sp. SSSA007]|uniref:putative porin n=1 Tax=Microbulbifer sp. SSSA007 TaxID=3243379 RepID=UPI00403A01D1